MARSDVEIVPAAGTDDEAIVQTVRAAIRTSAVGYYSSAQLEIWASGWGASGLDTMLAEAQCLVARADDAIVGFVALKGSEVDQLFVRPDYGGKGIARQLYDAVEVIARSKPITRLTAVASLRSAPVFQRFGFVVDEETTREYRGQSFDVVLVSKDLGR